MTLTFIFLKLQSAQARNHVSETEALLKIYQSYSGQEISRLLWTPKLRDRVLKNHFRTLSWVRWIGAASSYPVSATSFLKCYPLIYLR
jgi:hypothetical protein